MIVRAVINALRVLDALAAAPGPMGVTELARRLGLAPSTTHRLLGTLVRAGYARHDPVAGRYRRGPALLRLSAAHPAPPAILLDAARPVLRRLADESRETAHLAILDGLDVLAVDHAESARPVVARHAVGSRVPAHATAVGLALLAHHPEVAEALAASGLDRLTDATLADGRALERQLEEVRQRGYAVNVRGWLDETAGVAAPVITRDGEAIAAVGISGPASRLGNRAVLLALGPLARAGAREIAERLAPAAPAHPGAGLSGGR
jgi:DNA-binding IclR family transcriptional regulator